MYPLCLMFTLSFFLLAFLGSAITTATILGYSRVLILLIIILTLNMLFNEIAIFILIWNLLSRSDSYNLVEYSIIYLAFCSSLTFYL